MSASLLPDFGPDLSLTSILSTSELMTREGAFYQKSMNFRDRGGALSVVLVLPSSSGEYGDAWDPSKQEYVFRGHDSVTVRAGGKEDDQLLMYEGGTLSDNGKFYMAARAYHEGERAEAHQVQVYEKLDAGTWFDKGIFNLIDARRVHVDGRVHFDFILRPADAQRADRDEVRTEERMLSASHKARIWAQTHGRCAQCSAQSGLRFVPSPPSESASEDIPEIFSLICPVHHGERIGGGLLG